MSYSRGQMIRMKHDHHRFGEILQHMGNGTYYVRIPVYGDEDRDFELVYVDYTAMEPICFSTCMDTLHGRYRKETHLIPS